MKDFGLSDAVDSVQHYSSASGTLWGIYAVATFTASGFGVSMGDRFTVGIATYLTIGFLAFTIGHFSFVRHHSNIQRRLSTEIGAYLAQDKLAAEHFRDSILAICSPDNRLLPVVVTHLVIDTCVIIIIWSTAR
ncbi:MAG: hypothetical protein LC808_43360 [Actinobacteria bacterium]|nr:hypothetical protein [Actinomycetota bacterium]